MKNIAQHIGTYEGKAQDSLLRSIGRSAHARGERAYIVGGVVRDILLGVGTRDLDVVIEGDGIAFARVLAERTKATMTAYDRFKTATVRFSDGSRVDVATSRCESYDHPAALPRVFAAPLIADLKRRDFTVNAIAVSLDPLSYGEIVDPLDGVKDLKKRRIAVIHGRSFIDDPTRIIRAVRFEQRLGFTFEPKTLVLMRKAIRSRMIQHTTRTRIGNEFIRSLKEEHPSAQLKRMSALGILEAVDSRFVFDTRMKERFSFADKIVRWYESSLKTRRPVEKWLVYLMTFFDDLDTGDVDAWCRSCQVSSSVRSRLRTYKENAPATAAILSNIDGVAPRQLLGYLETLSYEVMLAIIAKVSDERSRQKAMRAIKIASTVSV